MTYSWWEVSGWIVLLGGAAYCFWPCVSNLLDLWANRRHVRKVFREASTRRKVDGDAVSRHWLRQHGYDRDGDKVA
jgi:hypothetical protein